MKTMALTGKLTQTDTLSKCVMVYMFSITQNSVLFLPLVTGFCIFSPVVCVYVYLQTKK